MKTKNIFLTVSTILALIVLSMDLAFAQTCGSCTTNIVLKCDGTSNCADSQIKDDGTNLVIPTSVTAVGKLTLEQGSTANPSTFINTIESEYSITVTEPSSIGSVISSNSGNNTSIGSISLATGSTNNIGFCGDATQNSAGSNLGVRGTAIGTSTTYNAGVYGSGRNGGFNLGVYGVISGGEGVGMLGEVIFGGSTTGISEVRGVSGGIEIPSGSSVTDASAVEARIYDLGGTITNAYGVRVEEAVGQTAYGVYIDEVEAKSTNAYGIFIADVTASNDYGLWQDNTADNNYLAGTTGIGTSSPSEKLDVDGNGRFRAIISSGSAKTDLQYVTATGVLTSAASDRRLKTDITPLTGTMEKVLKLQGVSFYWKDEPEKTTPDIGFIAQEVEKVYPEVVFTNPVDGYMGINYSRFPAILVEAIKEQHPVIEGLQQKNKELAAKLEELTALVNKLSTATPTDKATTIQQGNFNESVFNVFPNPTNHTLNVNYTLKSGKSVQIELADLGGKVQKSLTVNNLQGTQTIDVSKLPIGNYIVVLKADGVVVSTQTVAVAR